ncbi:hypothetical protein PQX77_020162, partial [Marasmius sp. AFHP31]
MYGVQVKGTWKGPPTDYPHAGEGECHCLVFLRALNVGYWGENELVLHPLRNQAQSWRTPSNTIAAPGSSYAQPHTSPFTLKVTPAEILCDLTRTSAWSDDYVNVLAALYAFKILLHPTRHVKPLIGSRIQKRRKNITLMALVGDRKEDGVAGEGDDSLDNGATSPE